MLLVFIDTRHKQTQTKTCEILWNRIHFKFILKWADSSAYSFIWHLYLPTIWAYLVAQVVKNLPAIQETWVWSLGQEDPLENETAIHSSIPAWRIAWTGSLAVLGLQRIGHHLATKHNNNDLVRHLWLVCQFTNSDTGWAPTVCETVYEVLEILGGHKEAGKTELMQNVSFLLQTHRHVRQI